MALTRKIIKRTNWDTQKNKKKRKIIYVCPLYTWVCVPYAAIKIPLVDYTETHSPLTRDRQLSKMSPGFPFPQQSGRHRGICILYHMYMYAYLAVKLIHEWIQITTHMWRRDLPCLWRFGSAWRRASSAECTATWFPRKDFTERNSFITKMLQFRSLHNVTAGRVTIICYSLKSLILRKKYLAFVVSREPI